MTSEDFGKILSEIPSLPQVLKRMTSDEDRITICDKLGTEVLSCCGHQTEIAPCSFRRDETGVSCTCIELREGLSTQVTQDQSPAICHCRNGCIVLVAPILLDGEVVGHIRCGPYKARDGEYCDADHHTDHRSMVRDSELVTLPHLKLDRQESLLLTLEILAAHASSLLQLAQSRMHELEWALRASAKLSSIYDTMMPNTRTDDFDNKLLDALEHIREIFGAAAIVVLDSSKADANFCVRSTAPSHLRKLSGRTYDLSHYVATGTNSNNSAQIVSYASRTPGTICYDVSECLDTALVHSVGVFPCNTINNSSGMFLIFFQVHSTSSPHILPILSALIDSVNDHIKLAHDNFVLGRESTRILTEQEDWFENVAHQLINPLNSLVQDVDMLGRRVSGGISLDAIDVRMSKIVSVASLACRRVRMFELDVRSRQILARSDIRTRSELNPLLIGVAIDLQGWARSLRVAIHVNPSITRPQVSINRPMISLAFTNLIENAVKYSNRDNMVIVNISEMGADIIVEVENTGTAIEVSELESIFQRGYRTLAARRKTPIGTGLGLAVTRRIIEAHDGQVYAKSTPIADGSSTHVVQFVVNIPQNHRRKG